MSRIWFWLLLLPFVYLVVAGRLSRGFGEQPRVVLAWSPARLDRAVEHAGGRTSVRTGLWLDLVFIAGFALIATPLLYLASGPWVTPVVAASLDLAENALLAWILSKKGEGRPTRLLAVVAASKFAAYVVFVAVVVRTVLGPS